MLEAHILHGNKLGIDPLSVSWRRCVDINDRAMRDILVGLGGDENGVPRRTGFDIAVASELMAILALAEYVDKMHAVCMRCGGPAHYSQRIAGGADQVQVGDAESYEARCRRCYEPWIG